MKMRVYVYALLDGVNGAVVVCWVAAFLTDFARDGRFATLFKRLQLQGGMAK